MGPLVQTIDTTNTSVNEVHQEILYRAAEIANANPDKHPQFFFTPLGVDSNRTIDGVDGFRLDWDRENAIQGYPIKSQGWIALQMNSIGQDAVKEAIREKADLLVGLIVGEARKGRNYFDNFSTDASIPTI